MNSILSRLLWVLLAAITLTTFLAAVQGYQSSMRRASTLFDSELQALAQTLISARPQTQVKTSLFAWQIWHQGELVSDSGHVSDRPLTDIQQGFDEGNFLGQRWRVFSLHDADSMVQVAQPLAQRFDLAESLILSAMTPLIISIPLLAMIIGLIVTRALKPLTSLAERLRATRVEELGEVDSAHVPGELKPVVDTINRLFARVDEAFTREKRFASDAAHELRTPLSILRITAHNISVMQSPQPELIQALQAGVERMSHVVDQILLLNRTNPEHFTKRLLPLRIDKLAQDVIADMFEQIDVKQQSIELQASETTVAGDEFTLRTLLQNLIGNASKYTPAGGNILVNIVNLGRQVTLSVEDSGPGISPDERQRALQRFYRIGGDRHTSDTEGCGLGLSIVQQIAQLHGAQFELDDSEVLGGLAARVVFKGHPA